MKTAQQKQQDEIGIFLSMTRKKNGLAQKDVAKVLGHGSQNFVSRIEKGKAIVPIGKIRDFADAYHLPFFPFGRLVLSSMHPEAHEVFSMILNAEPELGRTAKRCHVKDAKARKERIKLFDSDMKADALAEVRHFLEKNKIFISKSKRTIFENEKNETGLISLLLSAFRQRYGLSQDTVAQRLGYTGPQLVSRIEAGKSPIPLIKINEFATAYEFAKHARMSGVRLEPFARVVLADMHPETYRAFMDFLKHEDRKSGV